MAIVIFVAWLLTIIFVAEVVHSRSTKHSWPVSLKHGATVVGSLGALIFIAAIPYLLLVVLV